MANMEVWMVISVWAFNKKVTMQMIEATEEDSECYRSYLINNDQTGEYMDVILLRLQQVNQVIRTKPVRMWDLFKGDIPWKRPIEEEAENVFTPEKMSEPIEVYENTYEETDVPIVEDTTKIAFSDYLKVTERYYSPPFIEPGEKKEENAAVGGEGGNFEKMVKKIKEKIIERKK